MRISVPHARLGSTMAKFVMTAVTAALLSGCSDSIERFSSNYNNPSDADPVYTASVPKYKKAAVKRYAAPRDFASNEETIVQSPIASAPVYKAKAPSYDYTKAYKKPKLAYNDEPATPVYKAPTYKKPVFDTEQVADENVDSAPQAPVYKRPALAKSTATVRVASGMTMYSIAKANGVSVKQLAAANGIVAPYTVSNGRVLRIPGKTTGVLPATASAEDVVQVAPKKMKSGGSHTVAQGETLFSLGRQYGVSPFAIADLNGMPHTKALSLGQQLRIPAGATSSKIALNQELGDDQEAIADDDTSVLPPQKVATAPLALPKEPVLKPGAEAPADASTLAMRWPVKGKVISEFGAKPNGLKNEGINIAVPEGTSIRAAESGVVAYAGNELKGYGNLILVRHAGGYVTAYAHASELMVKRGDTVKRGDVIAKAGQTGAVQSPQLHFEVRKGASALDPYKYLSSSTAMN
jgi:murein DD-endopeptidase MepM/ murein hydrolase activator NlpD